MTSLRQRRPSAAVPGADLDVTPVMNMFIILIPFLVSMAAFTQLAVHEFGLPRDEGAGEAQAADELPLTVVLESAGILVVRGDVVVADPIWLRLVYPMWQHWKKPFRWPMELSPTS